MKYKVVRATVCAVAAALMISNISLEAAAASGTSAALPAAGLGLTMGDGASISDIRDDAKKNKEEKLSQADQNKQSTSEKKETETAYETETSRDTQDSRETETGRETQGSRETETGDETQGSRETETKSSRETESSAAETEAAGVSRTEESAEEETELEIVEAVMPVIKEPKVKLSDAEISAQEDEEVLIIAQVSDYVNIRSIPSTDGEIVGKLYNNSVGTLISEEDGWYKMKSGNVDGYVKAEYFKSGAEARRIADEVGNKIATVNTTTLKVRSEASLEASVLGLVPMGDELTVLDEENNFVKVSIEEGDGWVSMDYVIVQTEYVTAESIEEEKARLEKEQKAKEEARKAAQAAEERIRAEQAKKEQTQTSGSDKKESSSTQQASAPVVSSGSGLGAAVANYACQFVGNPYVYGGTSLTNGADCSGFVMSVYKNFGVSLPHSSAADRSVGYSVGSLAEAQPGDLICYSGHVAIYIGNGQIVHASTAATGIKISNANYRTPVAIRRIF